MVCPTTPSSKSRAAGAVFALLVLSAFAVVNLPYRYTQGGGVWVGKQMLERYSLQTDARGTRVLAGWPLRYQIDYADGERVERRWWSHAGWMTNAAIALLAAGAVFAGTRYRYRKIQLAADPARIRKCFDIATALALVLIPTSVWAVAAYQARRDLRLARQTADRGACFLAWQLPEVLANRLPKRLENSVRRLRRVHLDEPSEELVRRMAQVAMLSEYHLHGGTYRHEALEPLRSASHLVSLSVTGRDLDAPLLQAISAPQWLSRLSLSQTNLDATLLKHLDRLDSLRVLDLSQTPLQLDQLGNPAWSQTVHTLVLPRPPSGRGDCLTLEHWPCLQHLSVKRLPLVPNNEPLKLRLMHLPELTQLALDRVQKHDLVIRDLPRLITIRENSDSVADERALMQSVPGGTWVSGLQLDRVPSLSRLICFARDLERLSIRGCTRLRQFELTPYSVSTHGTSRAAMIEPARCQRWIDALGRSDGPAELRLEGLPLSTVDLAPLAGNHGIRCLKLSGTGVRFEQIRALVPLQQLERLEVADCPLQAEQLQWLLERFPKLKQLRADLERLQRLEIVGNERLEQIGENRIQRLQELRICDAPRLQGGVRVVETPRRIVIRDAPRLSGLAVEGPWPKDATVRGLRKLRWFAAGGPEVDDALVESLLDCDQLGQLTLAYSSVSRRQLARLGVFDALTQLALPGADVDDTVTRHWHKMQLLRTVNLDDTAIGAGTLDWLSRLDGLRRLSLRRVVLDDRACQALAGLNRLLELDLNGTPVPPAAIAPILANNLLEKLDLSGHHCRPPLIELVADCESLRTLVLHHAQIEPRLIERLLSDNPNLHVAMDPLPPALKPGLVAELERRGRRAFNARSASISRSNTGLKAAFAPPAEDAGVVAEDVEAADLAEENTAPHAARSASRSSGWLGDPQTMAGYIDVRRFRP